MPGEHREEAEQRREEGRHERAHAHGDAERDGGEEGEHRADGDAQQARPDMGEQRPVLDRFKPRLQDSGQMRKDARIDVEIRDEDRPGDEQNREWRKEHRRRGNVSQAQHHVFRKAAGRRVIRGDFQGGPGRRAY